jgi:YbbR domain-containing protein
MNLKKVVKNNLAFKITAIVLAILLWFYVFYVFGAKATKTAQIQIQVEGLNPSYEVSLNQSIIRVTFAAPIQQIEQVEKNIRATMDLSNIGPGIYNRRPKLITPKEVEIIMTDPSSIEVTVESIISKDFPIKPTLKGKLQPGTMLGDVLLTPDKISLTGTNTALQNVTATIEIDISNAVSDLFGYAEIKVLNNKNEAVDNVTLSAKAVKFHIPIITSDITKTVPIVPNFIGTSRLAILSFSFTPPMITIRGSVKALESIQSLSSGPIDLSQLQENTTGEVEIILPTGIKREKETGKIKFTVQVEEIVTRTLANQKIQVRNNPFKTFVLSQETCNVTIIGRKSLVDNLQNVTVYVDLKNGKMGINEQPLLIQDIPQGLFLQCTPLKIEVKILD